MGPTEPPQTSRHRGSAAFFAEKLKTTTKTQISAAENFAPAEKVRHQIFRPKTGRGNTVKIWGVAKKSPIQDFTQYSCIF